MLFLEISTTALWLSSITVALWSDWRRGMIFMFVYFCAIL